MVGQSYPDLTDEAIEEARKLIGVELRRHPRWEEVGKELIIRFALAIGSRNSLYMSDELVSTNLMGAMLGHPTILYCFDDTLIAPKLPGVHALYAGADWEFFRPVLLHDRITPTARLLDVERKTGEFCGPMALQTGEVVYRNQEDEDISRVTSYVMRTPRDPARERGKYMGIPRYRYSPDDMEAIDRDYESEEIRGDVPRYWEDVEVGEQIPSIVKGPLASDDMLNFIDIVRGTLSFSYFLEHRRRHPQDVYWDPETGMPDSWDASMTKDSVAQAFGFPFSHDSGIQRVCWLENMVTNWMSNLGFLEGLKVRLVRPNFIYDTTWCKGRVTGKSIQDGSPRVEMEVWCENQRGEVTARGSATAALVSRRVDAFPPFVQFPQVAQSPQTL
jgi:acyl dehydratase